MTKTWGLLPKHRDWIEARDAERRVFERDTLELAQRMDALLARAIERGEFRCSEEQR